MLADAHESTVFDLATAYGYGFAPNHCFPDGNKRVALAAMDVFLMVNGQDLTADEVETVAVVRALPAVKCPRGVRARSSRAPWPRGSRRRRPQADLEQQRRHQAAERRACDEARYGAAPASASASACTRNILVSLGGSAPSASRMPISK